jgi:hydrogenase nickel incorporation protein HypA/HybF
MHEMGIVIHLAKTLDGLAEEHSITRIGSVTLSVGEVSGIVEDLFIDAWNYFRKKHPVLETAELEIITLPAVTWCDSCKQTYPTVEFGRTCPHCGSGETWLLKGNECIIKEIEAE